jgi:hypothetical protein
MLQETKPRFDEKKRILLSNLAAGYTISFRQRQAHHFFVNVLEHAKDSETAQYCRWAEETVSVTDDWTWTGISKGAA